MGSCSNRGLTKEEKLAGYAKQVFSCKDTTAFEWQTTTGARIRGELGIKRGNSFISDMNKYKKGG
ncbi:MAG: hypothetical protein WC942_10415 [Clostridia bacterium]|jgi:hypothetical protein